MLLLVAVDGGKPKFTIKALWLSAGHNQLYLRQVTRTGSRLLAPKSRSMGWLAERREVDANQREPSRVISDCLRVSQTTSPTYERQHQQRWRRGATAKAPVVRLLDRFDPEVGCKTLLLVGLVLLLAGFQYNNQMEP